MPPSNVQYHVEPTPAVSSTNVFRDELFVGKVVFCTGGSSGICKAIVAALMRHGASAFIVGRNADKARIAASELTCNSGRTCGYHPADVRTPDNIKEAVRRCIGMFGKIDFVVCGAAGNFLSTIDNLSENGFKTVIEIDTLGTFNTVKATLPYVRESRGAYLHISATLHYRGTPYQAHVSAAKAGVDALSAVLAVEEGPRGVRSNVIAPGPIAETEGYSRLSTGSEETIRASQSRYPLGRAGDLRDVSNAAIWLFSPAANWITGQVLAVDGGEYHVTSGMVPDYPQNVLDPDSMKGLIKNTKGVRSTLVPQGSKL
ncbi:NAD-P-binding protein [Cantharellus anzutake]|uniref:NAD-P-binding protein n=1 Tax=Cantharellus anzutake TaxID=1750568 RepID=UPI0019059288|nr:NAD-P-binding protein [Cantharellus anzutake]KAF8331493.1 NAD-P-binding protein [Cantharellus anzutake]